MFIKFDEIFSNNKIKTMLKFLWNDINNNLNNLDNTKIIKLNLLILDFIQNPSFFDFQFLLSLSSFYL